MGTSQRRWDDFARDQDGQLGSLRINLGWQLARHLALVGGPTYNVQTSWNGADHQPGFGVAERVTRDGSSLRSFRARLVSPSMEQRARRSSQENFNRASE